MKKMWLGTVVAAAMLVVAASIFLSHDTEAQASPIKSPTELKNRVALTELSDSNDSEKWYRITLPAGASDLIFTIYGKHDNTPVDLYSKFQSPPTRQSFDASTRGSQAVKTIAIHEPRSGVHYLLLAAPHGAYSDFSLVASYALPKQAFKIGMHAHRLYNGGDWSGNISSEPRFHYGLIRDWDITGLQDAVIWKADGAIDFPLVDRVYQSHAKHGAKVIKTFGTVPTWESKRPAELNKQYPNWPGAKSGPRDLDEYEDYVYRFVSHEKKSLWAVEGWNEPYSCPKDGKSEFTSMTPTELADVQKRVYRATKRVDPHILVFSPAQAYLCGIPTVLNARTSQGEPISKFFDAFAWHAYNRSANGDAGPSYAQEVMRVRRYLSDAGLSQMPIADTEHGWLEAPKEGGREFYQMTDAQKAQVLYQTAQMAKSLGLLAIVWYGYDDSMIGKPMTDRRTRSAATLSYTVIA